MTDPGMIEQRMSDSLIERMARAICRSIDGDESDWLAFTSAAHDALVAIQDPSLAVAVAGFETMQALHLECEGRDASRVWWAMIDAALKEKP